jgi:hypothetical protein
VKKKSREIICFEDGTGHPSLATIAENGVLSEE